MPTRYGRSPWLDRFPASRVPSFPRYRGDRTSPIVVVGGGLTGCAAAYAFAAAGVKVILLDADRIGRGATSQSAGWISDDPGVPFVDVEKALGLRAARRAWQAWRRAALDFTALLRRLEIKCDLEPHPTLTVATTPDQIARMKREQKARRDAGLDAPLVNARAVSAEAGLASSGGSRGRDSATVDPYRACLGLAAAAARRGAELFERSPVLQITFGRKHADVRTAASAIRTEYVVIATGTPTSLFKALARHFWFKTTYLALTERIPAATRRTMGRRNAVMRDSADPPHIVRWLDDEQALVMGADQLSPPDRLRAKSIVQRTGQLMYELSTMYPDISGLQPEYGWEASYALTGDGLPHVGPHRNFPRHLFAFGDASHSVTGAYLASRILLRYYTGASEAADEVFGFARALLR
jgi:glycine/D-amino acid oxidase-like deaminating enzyme